MKRLWKIPRRDPAKCYTKLSESPGIVAVVENGSRIIHREKVAVNEHAVYEIDDDGWLIEKTSPRRQVALAEARAERKRVGAARAAASRAPAFKAFVRELTMAFGTPKKARACDVSMLAFTPRARSSEAAEIKCHPWIDRARAAGGAATVYVDRGAVELRVLAGSSARLVALLGPRWWYGEGVESALDRLDRDAGLSFDFIASDDRFCLRLDREPTKLDAHARALAQVFDVSTKAVAAGLRATVWAWSA